MKLLKKNMFSAYDNHAIIFLETVQKLNGNGDLKCLKRIIQSNNWLIWQELAK